MEFLLKPFFRDRNNKTVRVHGQQQTHFIDRSNNQISYAMNSVLHLSTLAEGLAKLPNAVTTSSSPLS